MIAVAVGWEPFLLFVIIPFFFFFLPLIFNQVFHSCSLMTTVKKQIKKHTHTYTHTVCKWNLSTLSGNASSFVVVMITE